MAPPNPPSEAILTLSGVHTHIGQYHILQGVDLAVPRGGLAVLRRERGGDRPAPGEHEREHHHRQQAEVDDDVVDAHVALGRAPAPEDADPDEAGERDEEGGALDQGLHGWPPPVSGALSAARCPPAPGPMPARCSSTCPRSRRPCQSPPHTRPSERATCP